MAAGGRGSLRSGVTLLWAGRREAREMRARNGCDGGGAEDGGGREETRRKEVTDSKEGGDQMADAVQGRGNR